ncbi:hypothetical protein BBJ28_00001667 [Nothophytophthora sp. Chile5]|nr:hypothetical protein BBJ28_00001667 [Nothophytophthora sp. Chile5]
MGVFAASTPSPAGLDAAASLVSAIPRFLDDSTGPGIIETTLTPVSGGKLTSAAQSMRMVLVFILAGFVTIWLLCVGLVWHMRVNRRGALKGDTVAAGKTILPAFEPVLVVMSIFNGLYIVFLVVTLATDYYDDFVPPTVLESFYSGNQFMFVFVLVILLQKSLSLPAVRRSVVIALLLSSYTIPYSYVVSTYGAPNQRNFFVQILQGLRGLLMLPFAYVFIWPPSRATSRVIRELCAAAFVFYFLTVVLMILIVNPETVRTSRYVMCTLLTWVAFCPLIIWRVLKADTEYWRGIGQRACALQDLFQQGNGVHERVSSEGLHVLIEMHRKHVIDFAYLDLRRRLGVGSSSTIFQGTLKAKTHVAIKAYTPDNFTVDVVAAFSHEAAMCSVLSHPNIVRFHGMCVAPPTICLVFQLCQGNLEDTLRAQACRQNHHPARQQLLISIGYMLDAARAVAYLHSFSPPFIHCDIKPSNFLVDAECNVKLTDFGHSRTVPTMEDDKLATATGATKMSGMDGKKGVGLRSPMGATVSNTESPWSNTAEATGAAEYLAPEIIDGKSRLACYGEAADVYSLAITMWDILNPGANKFPHSNGNDSLVFESVLLGARPKLDKITSARLRETINRAWQRDPRVRPTAKQIVTALEDTQEELCARLVLDMMGELCEGPSGTTEASSGAAGAGLRMFPGAFVIDRMIDRRYVRSPAEGIRMGNALMDANLLHHAKHARSFENSASSMYCFDIDEARLSLPGNDTRTSNRSSTSSRGESSIPMLSRGSNGGRQRTSLSFVRTRNYTPCQCRQLGQRLHGGDKSSRFKLRRRESKAAPEPTAVSNILTTALLVEDEPSEINAYNDLSSVANRPGAIV